MTEHSSEDLRVAQRVLDSLNEGVVQSAAVKLCRDSLGDPVLWSATAELRAVLTQLADREPFPWPERWPLSPNDDNTRMTANDDKGEERCS